MVGQAKDICRWREKRFIFDTQEESKMFKIECPYCGNEQEINREFLPELSCDKEEFECSICGEYFDVGWYAEIELR